MIIFAARTCGPHFYLLVPLQKWQERDSRLGINLFCEGQGIFLEIDFHFHLRYVDSELCLRTGYFCFFIEMQIRGSAVMDGVGAFLRIVCGYMVDMASGMPTRE